MFLFDKVAVIGTGLIGGSIAQAIKRKRLAKSVVGVSKHKASISLAIRRKIIDKGSISLDIIKGADLLIIATPVNKITSIEKKLLKKVSKNCILTDVGSTKEKIVAVYSKDFPNFVGSHPLAGSEKRGIINASGNIFKDSICILTPIPKTNSTALRKVRMLWEKIGAKTIILTPEKHDKILAFVSHLPHVVAFSLVNSLTKNILKFSSTGLKDTTRIAESDSKLWKEIFLSNRENLLDAISSFEAHLNEIKSAILHKDNPSLGKILLKSVELRKNLK